MAEVVVLRSGAGLRSRPGVPPVRCEPGGCEEAIEGLGAIRRHEGVALFRLDTPSLGLWPAARAAAFAEALKRVAADPEISAIVLHGREVFADAPVADGEAAALAIGAVSQSARPVFAAIEGCAVGVGLELALACAGRAATPRSSFALPAVRSGRLPVCGGIARLQALIGSDAAARLIVFGERLDAPAALKAGVIDGMVAHGLARFAVALARSHDPHAARSEARRDHDGSPFGELASVRCRLRRAAPGQAAPLAAVRAMEAALRLPPRRADPEIAQLADRLAGTAQACALRHAAAAEAALAAATPAPDDVEALTRRLAWPFRREAVHLLDEGASPAQVDACLKAYGFESGVFAEADRRGLGAVFSLTGEDVALDAAWRAYSPTLDFMMDAGRTGGPGRQGWFRHEAGDAAQFDPEVERILTASAMFQTLHRRREADVVLERRCLDAMIAGSIDLLDACPQLGWREVDALWTTRLGFPRWRGGPLHQGALAGWAQVLERLEGQARTLGPAPERLRAWAEGQAEAPLADEA